jgi:hypothetical protein
VIEFIQYASAIFALAAAYFWFRSAMGNVPPPTSGWGGSTHKNDPFMIAFNKSMSCNRWAAGFAAASAVLSGIATILGTLSS